MRRKAALDLDKLAKRIYKEPVDPNAGLLSRLLGRQGSYWYITAMIDNKIYALGPYADEEEALESASANLGSDADFELVELPTKDKAKAYRLIRDRVLKETHNLPLTIQRMKHQPLNIRRLES